MTETFHRLPAYLKQYCVEQDYDAYTARDHASWRYIMRQNRDFFRPHAVPVYELGLNKTGIPIDRIPRISEMDEKLRQFGWGAIAVNGFIPPAAFLEFQALGVLAIACDMRTAEHIEYTPAPDIVHEAAGHAPILADPTYANYLCRYAKMAQKAIFSREDINVYEAIRYLSDIKENPDTQPEECARAEARFQAAIQAVSHVSEAAKVGRMAWWTVEYGLVGPLAKPLIYGAGLLSSMGESQNCLSDAVKKIPLSVDCVEQGFDITKPQPQLFVAEDMAQLTSVLEDLENSMAFSLGGSVGMARAFVSQMVNTITLDSGVEIAGQLTEYKMGEADHIEFVKFTGPVQIAHRGQQLLGQGRNRHASGFSSPLGRIEGISGPTHQASDSDLRKAGIERGRRTKIKFVSGFILEGVVAGWHRAEGNLLYITFRGATLRLGDKIYFEPSWGDFDLAVGERVLSVHGGPANRVDFGEYDVGTASTRPGRASPYSEQEFALFQIYQDLRNIRQDSAFSANKTKHAQSLEQITGRLVTQFPKEWLAALEICEIADQGLGVANTPPAWLKNLRTAVLDNIASQDPSLRKLIHKGFHLIHQA